MIALLKQVLLMKLHLIMDYAVWFIAALFPVLPSISSFNIDVDKPIIYQPPEPLRNALFGYSVGFKFSEQNSSWMVVIGAPRANDTASWVEPGAIYSCGITGPCETVPLLNNVNNGVQYNGTFNYDNAFIGVAMDIDSENFVVCGHGVAYQARKNPDDEQYMPVGGCFTQYGDTKEWLYPFAFHDEKLYKRFAKYGNVALRVRGMCGMSVSLDDGDNGILLGAPNYFISTGSIAYVPQFKVENVQVLEGDPKQQTKLWRAGYHGYSVAVVRNSSSVLFGSPRSRTLFGEAVLMETKDIFSTKKEYHNSSFSKASDMNYFGSYFGASLAGNDFNGDGHTDVVVGAPTYSDSELFERGSVIFYAFKPSNGSLSESNPIKHEIGVSSQSRFGACVAIPGDFDGDGLNDVFVGAPGEGSGSVYIFYGHREEVGKHKQVIRASDFDKPLSGFGISFSRGQDIDGNGFPDLAVGASDSDAVVLLRARPLVIVGSNISFDNTIERNLTMFNLEVCPFCESKTKNARCNIGVKIMVDIAQKRALIKGEGATQLTFMNVATNSGHDCQNVSVDMRKDLISTIKKDDWKPLKILVVTNLIHSKVSKDEKVVWEKKEALNELDVVCEKGCNASKDYEILFRGDCKDDQICMVNFTSTCSKNIEGALVLGEKYEAHFMMNVTNFGEPSRETTLSVRAEGIPSAEGISAPNCKCLSQQKDVQRCSCNLGYMAKNDQESITFHLHVGKWLKTQSTTVSLTGELTTSGQQIYTDGLRCKKEIELKSEAEVDLSTSSVSHIPAKGTALNFKRTFKFIKKGVSPVVFIDLTALVPVSICDFPLVQIAAPGVPIPAQGQLSHPSSINKSCMGNLRQKYYNNNRTLLIQCDDNNYVQCVNVTTKVERDIVIEIKFNASIFETLPDVNVIKYVSNGTARSVFPFNKLIVTTKSTELSINRSTDKGDFSAWILSFIIASMILATIVPVLVKIGFFRRKTKEMMDALKVQDFILERFSMHEPVVDDSVNLIDDSRSVSIKTIK